MSDYYGVLLISSLQVAGFQSTTKNTYFQMPFPVHYVGQSFRTVPFSHEDAPRQVGNIIYVLMFFNPPIIFLHVINNKTFANALSCENKTVQSYIVMIKIPIARDHRNVR